MNRSSFAKAILIGLVFSALLTRPAYAYLDPSTGGQLFQLLAVMFAFLSAILLFLSSQIRMGFARIRRFFRSRLGREEADGSEATTLE